MSRTYIQSFTLGMLRRFPNGHIWTQLDGQVRVSTMPLHSDVPLPLLPAMRHYFLDYSRPIQLDGQQFCAPVLIDQKPDILPVQVDEALWLASRYNLAIVHPQTLMRYSVGVRDQQPETIEPTELY